MSAGEEVWMVKCPFYKQERATQITCEGFSEGNGLQLFFRSKALLKEHQSRYCKSIKDHVRCPLYAVINEQYENKKGDRT